MQTEQPTKKSRLAYLTLVVTTMLTADGLGYTTKELIPECVTDAVCNQLDKLPAAQRVQFKTEGLGQAYGESNGPNGSSIKGYNVLDTISRALAMAEFYADSDHSAERQVQGLKALADAFSLKP